MHRHIAQAFSLILLAVLLSMATPIAAQGTPIGFAEDWALATDRAKVLDQLIPGTSDYYYYNCRHHQDTGAFDKVEPLLRAWVQRHGRRARVEEIEMGQRSELGLDHRASGIDCGGVGRRVAEHQAV